MKSGNQVEPHTIQRIGAILHRIHPITDSAGIVIHHIAQPLKVELRKRDLAQIIVGASILSIPVGFTEEVWRLGAELPVANVAALGLISLVFIAAFVYSSLYRDLFAQFRFEYAKRVVAIYLISLAVVALLLTVIRVAPWTTAPLVAVKRVIIVAFPASMSAALGDSIS